MNKIPDWGLESLLDEIRQEVRDTRRLAGRRVLDGRVMLNKDERGQIAEKRVLPVDFVPLIGSPED